MQMKGVCLGVQNCANERCLSWSTELYRIVQMIGVCQMKEGVCLGVQNCTNERCLSWSTELYK